MKITKHPIGEAIFPYIAQQSDNIIIKPALIVQLHGAGERGNGGKDTEKALVHGFSKIDEDFYEELEEILDLVEEQKDLNRFWYWLFKVDCAHQSCLRLCASSSSGVT